MLGCVSSAVVEAAQPSSKRQARIRADHLAAVLDAATLNTSSHLRNPDQVTADPKATPSLEPVADEAGAGTRAPQRRVFKRVHTASVSALKV